MSESDSRRTPTGRVLALGPWHFRLRNNQRLIDAIMDGVGWFFESVIFLIGPILILLALGIASLLTYAFATILVPMLEHKYQATSYGSAVIAVHVLWVAFLLVNVLFNYALCIATRHKGHNYDAVVRELAMATDFHFPLTSEQVDSYRREYEDKMILRMQRRLARAQAQAEPSGVTQRRTATSTSDLPILEPPPPPEAQPVRRWMYMGPYEWGFCGKTGQPKPPRSHYDHVTKLLVLNLDHYCPWMFNAIGYLNYRYFVNFLIYIFISMVYGALLTLEPFLLLSSADYKHQWRQHQTTPAMERLRPMLPFRSERMLITLVFMLCIAVGFAVALLGGFHLYLTLTAQTTIEFHANWQSRRRAKQSGQKWKNPYSLGWQRNWQQVYGERPWYLAILPSRREPEFLPVPIPGQSNRRSDYHRNKTEVDAVNNGDLV